MSTIIEFWEADGSGEALIRRQRCKVLEALAQAACARPQNCVMVTLRDTRPDIPETTLWIRPGYHSSTVHITQKGLLNFWKSRI